MALVGLIRGAFQKINNPQSNWHRYLDVQPFSTIDFYDALQKEISAKEIPRTSISEIYYPEGGIFSVSRKYLRVSCGKYVFDICAAPFATGFFVSYWMGEMPNPIRDMLKNAPIIGGLFRKRQKTFFELDNELLFKEIVSTSVKKVFEEMIAMKGKRNAENELPTSPLTLS